MNFNWLSIYNVDTYKVGHKPMLPVGSTLMQSNFTPRSGKNSNCPNNGKIVSFGQQMLVMKIQEDWKNNFFNRPIVEIDDFAKDMGDLLMFKEPIDVTHFKQLHTLGYLPIEIRSIQEGTEIKYKVPFYTIVNTKPLDGGVFDWIVNYLETILSAEAWNAPTSATLGLALRRLGNKWIAKTDPENAWFVDYQFHNFSMRGMDGMSSIVNSGLGFATTSRGSDTLPVIPAARKFYFEKEVCINSVIASEHAIMCSLTGFFVKTKEGSWDKIGEVEVETFRYLLRKFPTGILSLVSDTWDLWRVIVDYCRILKDEILARDGKLVIRPDSGDPVDIICGIKPVAELDIQDCLQTKTKRVLYNGDVYEFDGDGFQSTLEEYGENDVYQASEYFTKIYVSDAEKKGVIELLWDIFGGDTSSTGYKRLNSHIGAIYGDSITYSRAEQMFERLAAKGFASTNIVLGVGSYSLQFVTRDTHGFAQKATYIEIEVNGVTEGIEIFKDPITDSGVKKSARGLIMVVKDAAGDYVIKDRSTWAEVNSDANELKVIFRDSVFYNQTTLTAIRERLAKL
jgi:nicotinamide phosphoribosyltransferase